MLFVLIRATLHAEVKRHPLFGSHTVLPNRNTLRVHGVRPTVAQVESGAALQN